MKNGKAVGRLSLKLKRRLTKELILKGVNKEVIETAIKSAEMATEKKYPKLTRQNIKQANQLLAEEGTVILKLSAKGKIYFINHTRVKVHDKRIDYLRSDEMRKNKANKHQ